MEEKGYITSKLDAPPSGTGGLPRRIYAMTALGRRMFMAWTSGAKQLVPEFGR
jgi:DNA-binding PadR family transcriptional regulator